MGYVVLGLNLNANENWMAEGFFLSEREMMMLLMEWNGMEWIQIELKRVVFVSCLQDAQKK